MCICTRALEGNVPWWNPWRIPPRIPSGRRPYKGRNNFPELRHINRLSSPGPCVGAASEYSKKACNTTTIYGKFCIFTQQIDKLLSYEISKCQESLGRVAGAAAAL